MLFVSCQPYENEDYYTKDFILNMAKAAKMGGSKGLRIEGVENIEFLRKKIDIAIIGIIKHKIQDKERYICPTIEDIDRIFNEDKLIQQDSFSGKGKLTMDCLLNTISGIESADGILVMVTANDVTKLDEALGVPDDQGVSSRPGRLDKILTFGNMEEHCRQAMAELILSDCQHLIVNTVKDGDSETGAQFEKRCSDIALREFWKPQ